MYRDVGMAVSYVLQLGAGTAARVVAGLVPKLFGRWGTRLRTVALHNCT